MYSQQKPGRQHWDRSICRPALQSGHSSEGIELHCVEKESITVTLQLRKTSLSYSFCIWIHEKNQHSSHFHTTFQQLKACGKVMYNFSNTKQKYQTSPPPRVHEWVSYLSCPCLLLCSPESNVNAHVFLFRLALRITLKPGLGWEAGPTASLHGRNCIYAKTCHPLAQVGLSW